MLDKYPIIVSIITVVYNAENYLEETIKSVINQSYPLIEYIIIDGGSQDKTLSIIQQYEDKISYWISQPDEGIYDAMNKGISLAQGQIIGILNAGDIYLQDTINSIVETYKTSQKTILTGYCKTFLENEKNWILAIDNHSKISYQMIPHSSVFVPREIYQSHGLFDTSFRIAADYDFICRCLKKQVPFQSLNAVLSIAAKRGTSGNYYLTEAEFLRVRLHHQLISPLVAITYSLRSFITITIHRVLSQLGLWKFIEVYRHGRTY